MGVFPWKRVKMALQLKPGLADDMIPFSGVLSIAGDNKGLSIFKDRLDRKCSRYRDALEIARDDFLDAAIGDFRLPFPRDKGLHAEGVLERPVEGLNAVKANAVTDIRDRLGRFTQLPMGDRKAALSDVLGDA